MKKYLAFFTMFLLALVMFLGTDTYAAESYTTVTVTGTFDYDKAYEVLELTNAERAKVGLPALTMDKDLLEAAMQRAAEIAINFDHVRPDKTMCSTVSSKLFGENIAGGNTTASATMTQWMNSTGHKANILNSSFVSIGVGCFYQNGKYYWVQTFGRSAATTGTKPANAVKTKTIVIANSFLESAKMSIVSDTGRTMFSTGTEIKCQCRLINFDWSSAWAVIDSDYVTVTASDTAALVSTGPSTFIGCKAGGYTVTGSLKAYPSVKGSATISFMGSDYIPEVKGQLEKDAKTGDWYYCYNGTPITSKTGIVENASGKWYVENGKINFKKRGVVVDNGIEYVVHDGYMSTGFYGLVKKDDGTWAYAEAGVLTYKYTGLANNEAGWWYITNGVIDFKFTGIGSNKTGDYRVVNGQIDFNYDGWFNANGNWWYMKGGMVDKTKAGLVKKDSSYYYVENGEINFNYTGLAKNGSNTYYVKNGYLDFSFSGTVIVGGKKYTVTKGIVK